MSKVEDKKKIFKVEREKQLILYKGTSTKISADFFFFFLAHCRPKGMPADIQSAQRKTYLFNQKYSTQKIYPLELRRTKESPRQAKLKKFITTKLVL